MYIYTKRGPEYTFGDNIMCVSHSYLSSYLSFYPHNPYEIIASDFFNANIISQPN